jgi:hypothetical protein
VKDVS